MAARSRAASMRQTREALLAAALEAFAEQGFDAPSLDAICARAGLTRGAFYVHFHGRDDLVVGVVDRVMMAFLDTVVARDQTDGGLEAIVQRFVQALGLAAAPARGPRRREPLLLAGLLPLHRILEAASRSPAIRERLMGLARDARDRIAAAVAAAQGAGGVRRDVAPGATAALLVATALGVLVGAEVGVPLELALLHETLLCLLSAPATAAAARARARPRARRA